MRRIGIGSEMWSGRQCPSVACDICRLSADSDQAKEPSKSGTVTQWLIYGIFITLSVVEGLSFTSFGIEM